MLICSASYGTVTAQLRKIPAECTDAFKNQYPTGSQASWSDKLSYFQVNFSMDSGIYIAKYDSKGVWKGSEQTVTTDKLPAQVKEGYDKSKYTDEWKIKECTVLYLTGNVMEYRLLIRKSGIQKRYLLFNASGKLLSENSTL